MTGPRLLSKFPWQSGDLHMGLPDLLGCNKELIQGTMWCVTEGAS